MSASEARGQLFPLLGRVNADHDVVRITSKAGNGVLISEDDYEAWQTTRYLFSTPANARRLVEAGANLLVAGSSVFGGSDPATRFRELAAAAGES